LHAQQAKANHDLKYTGDDNEEARSGAAVAEGSYSLGVEQSAEEGADAAHTQDQNPP